MKNMPFAGLSALFARIEATGRKKSDTMTYASASNRAVRVLGRLKKGNNKVMVIGNGGSAGIASHVVTDFLKNVGIAALAFNDAAQITCLSNDLGYEAVFRVPVEKLARRRDILIALSSSGASRNILDAVKAARRKGCFVITLSGFGAGNPLRAAGDINFYVPSHSYGDVELVHQAICHQFADTLM